MNNTIVRSSLAALALAGMLATATAAPARADGAASTRTIIAGLAAAAAIATIVNVDNKNAEANRVVGYLQDGSTVYADGRVVARNGYAWYPGNNGQAVSCNGQQCYLVASNDGSTTYNNTAYNGYDNSYDNGYDNSYDTYGYGGGYPVPVYGGGYPVPVYGSVNIYSGSRGYSGRANDNRGQNTHWQGRFGGQRGNGGSYSGGGSHSGGGDHGGGYHSGGDHGGGHHGGDHNGSGQHS